MKRKIEYLTNMIVAYNFSSDEEFAKRANSLLRIWFLRDVILKHCYESEKAIWVCNEKNNFRDQSYKIFLISDFMVKGVVQQELSEMEKSRTRDWFESNLNWLLTTETGLENSFELDNYGTCYDLHVAALAAYLNKDNLAKEILNGVKYSRMEFQIDYDGSQPLELYSSNAWNNSLINLSALFKLAEIGEKYNIDLWDYKLCNGASLQTALDFILPAAVNLSSWGYEQFDKPHLEELYLLLEKSKEKYDRNLYSLWIEKIYGNSKPQIIHNFS